MFNHHPLSNPNLSTGVVSLLRAILNPIKGLSPMIRLFNRI